MGRIEDIREVGHYITYDISSDSVIIVRTAADTLRAFHNVCPHRGRCLIDTPPGARYARGIKTNIICGFQGRTLDLEGRNVFIEHKDDWQGCLDEHRTSLGSVPVDSWGCWAFINLDGQAEPLSTYLDPAAPLLEPYQLQNMRPRWRKWVVFACNWKIAMEAFAETYYVASTHP